MVRTCFHSFKIPRKGRWDNSYVPAPAGQAPDRSRVVGLAAAAPVQDVPRSAAPLQSLERSLVHRMQIGNRNPYLHCRSASIAVRHNGCRISSRICRGLLTKRERWDGLFFPEVRITSSWRVSLRTFPTGWGFSTCFRLPRRNLRTLSTGMTTHSSTSIGVAGGIHRLSPGTAPSQLQQTGH